MYSIRCLAVGLAVAAVLLSAPLGAQTTSKGKTERIVPIGYGGGKIIGVDDDEKTFTLRLFGASATITPTGNSGSC